MSESIPAAVTRVAIVGGFPLYRAGLVQILKQISDVVDVTELARWEQIADHKAMPDLVLLVSEAACKAYLDLRQGSMETMPKAIVFTPWLSEMHRTLVASEAGRVVVLPLAVSLSDAQRYIAELLLKGGHLSPAIVERELQHLFLPDPCEFTRRERQVFRYLGDGLDNKDIAARLNIEKNTVKVFVSRIYKKTGVFNRTQAACLFTTVAHALN